MVYGQGGIALDDGAGWAVQHLGDYVKWAASAVERIKMSVVTVLPRTSVLSSSGWPVQGFRHSHGLTSIATAFLSRCAKAAKATQKRNKSLQSFICQFYYIYQFR